MPTIELALKLAEMWTVGTVYTVENNEDFSKFLKEGEAKNFDFENGLNEIREKHGITAKITCLEK